MNSDFNPQPPTNNEDYKGRKRPKPPKEPKQYKEPKPPKEPKRRKEPKPPKPPKEPKQYKEPKPPKEPKRRKEPKPQKEPKESGPIQKLAKRIPRRGVRGKVKVTQRAVRAILGAMLAILAIIGFVVIQSRGEVKNVSVLVAARAISANEVVTIEDFDTQPLPNNSPLLSSSLTLSQFNASVDSVLVAQTDISIGTIVNVNHLVRDSSQGSENKKVEFSVFIPNEGFPTGPPSVGTRVAVFVYIPSRAEPFIPLVVESITAVTGNRISFRTTIARAARLQVAQLSAAQQNGYIILWNAAPGLLEAETLKAATLGFSQAGAF